MPEAVAALEPCAKTTSAEPPTATAIAIESARRDAASFLMVETPLYEHPENCGSRFCLPQNANASCSHSQPSHGQMQLILNKTSPESGRCLGTSRATAGATIERTAADYQFL